MDFDTVLVVDDEPEICGQLSIFLSRKGYRVVVATDGAEALTLFEQHKPAVVITDYQMPGLNGLELLKAIKRQTPNTEVLVISGQADMKVAVTIIKEHAFDFIPKPIDLEQIEQKLSEAVDRSRKSDFAARAAHGVALTHQHEEGRHGMVSVIHCGVPLDEFSRIRIQKDFDNLMGEPFVQRLVVLSLRGIDYMNNVGLNILIDMEKALKQVGKKLVLVDLHARILAYLKSLGYHEFFKISNTTQTAIKDYE